MQNKDKRYLAEESLEKLRNTIIGLFSEGLYHQVGIREICKQAGVSPHTVYKYFGSKEDLLYASIAKDMQVLASEITDVAAQGLSFKLKLTASSRAFFDFYRRNPAIAKIVFLNIPISYWVDRNKYVQNRYKNYILLMIQEGQKNKAIAAHDPEFLLEMVMGAAYRLIVKWLVDENCDFEIMVKTFNDVVQQFILVD